MTTVPRSSLFALALVFTACGAPIEGETTAEQAILTDATQPASLLSLGWYSGCGITAGDGVSCWGTHEFGDTSGVTGISEVALGAYHGCIRAMSGQVFCAGKNDKGQTTVPSGLFSAVRAGTHHTCALEYDGKATCWGWNAHGQATPPNANFASIAPGRYHTCGADDAGNATCWGYNGYGMATPTVGVQYARLSAGAFFTCGITLDGNLDCFGWGGYGLSNPPEGNDFIQVTAGDYHACALRTDGTAACWGANSYGKASPPAETFTQLAAGYHHTCGLKPAGEIVCWGSNTKSQLDVPSIEFKTLADPFCDTATEITVAEHDFGVNYDSFGGSSGAALSADGRYLIFRTETALIAGDTDLRYDTYVFDRVTNEYEIVSVATTGAGGVESPNFPFMPADISADGRFAVFTTATQLTSEDDDVNSDIYLRDRQTNETFLVSLANDGTNGFSPMLSAAVSDDGSRIAFGGIKGVYLRDRAAGTTVRIDQNTAGVVGDGSDFDLSGDGSTVVFESHGALVPADPDQGIDGTDIYARDVETGAFELVSVNDGGEVANGYCRWPSVSSDGRYVVYRSSATNLVPGASGHQVYLRDRVAGTTTLVSQGIGGPANNTTFSPKISADGRYATFHSRATNLVAGVSSSSIRGYVRDLQTGTTSLVTEAPGFTVAISGDGKWIVHTPFVNGSEYITMVPNTALCE